MRRDVPPTTTHSIRGGMSANDPAFENRTWHAPKSFLR